MTNPDYKKYYSILGVFPDDDWETVRAAYKRQIRRWHPDRFQDTEQRKIAEAKSKDINLAYQALEAYLREYETLPPDGIIQSAARPGTEQPVSPTSEYTTQPEHYATAGSAYSHAASGKPVQPPRRRYSRIILAILVLAIAYTMLEPVITGELKVSEPAQSAYSASTLGADSYPTERADIADSALEMSTNSSASVLANATNQAADANLGWHSNKGGQAQKSSAVPGSPTFISRGSSKQEVLAIQGRPLRQTDAAWDYGLSRINFREGKVDSWYENPMNPLNVQR